MGLDIFAQRPTSDKISGEKITFWRLAWCIELNFRILLWGFHYGALRQKTALSSISSCLVCIWNAQKDSHFHLKLQISAYEVWTLWTLLLEIVVMALKGSKYIQFINSIN